MWFTAVDIASTPGGHAGMQRSQPLQWSTSMVTVPRLLIVLVIELGMRRAPFPGRVLVRGEQLPTRTERTFVGLDVLCAVRRDRLPHRLDERLLLDDPGRAGVRAEHHHRTAERVAEVGRDGGRGEA